MRPRRARDWGRAFSAWILALVVVSGITMAGRSYLWCVPMQRTMSSCCEGSADPIAHEETAPSVRSGCCDERSLGAMPSAASEGPAVSLPSASQSFVTLPAQPALPSVAPRLESALVLRAPASARAGPIRMGPGHASRAYVSLQVFRC